MIKIRLNPIYFRKLTKGAIDMIKGKQKALSVSVLLAILGMSYAGTADAAEAPSHSFELEKVVVEAERALPGEMANGSGTVGILGSRDAMNSA